MDERNACALLKQRFEAAGFKIEENRPFEEEGIAFELDGFDPAARVGYEYISSEAGDSWDVDADVQAALEARRKKGEVHILFVDEADAAQLEERADAFLAGLKPPAKKKRAPAAKKDPVKKQPAKKESAKKEPVKKEPAKKEPLKKEPAAAKKQSAAKKQPAD